jgi:hypothetical protein
MRLLCGDRRLWRRARRILRGERRGGENQPDRGDAVKRTNHANPLEILGPSLRQSPPRIKLSRIGYCRILRA